MSLAALQFDEIGGWSEIKLEILDRYLERYSQIMNAPGQKGLRTRYIDAFAGSGKSVARSSGSVVNGSPLIGSKYKFDEYHYIELDPGKANSLMDWLPPGDNVFIYNEDCNETLLSKVLPRVCREDRCRGFCFLDPYGLHLDWKVVETAGRLGTIDIILNFPVMDMHRNVFWRHPQEVDQRDIERMNAFWGDESWRRVAYKEDLTFFGTEEQKALNIEIALAYRDRLIKVAGFKEVPRPCPMRNSRGGIIYYLFFASQKDVAAKIMSYIFRHFGTPRPEHE